MIKYALPAAMAALVLGAPVLAQAQMAQPMPLTNPTNPMMSNTATTTTVTAQPQPGEGDGLTQAGAQPALAPSDMMPMGMAPVPPGATWIPGHYSWDARAGNYVWNDGQFAQAPHPNAQWVAGHWQETPTSWIWLDGRWN